MNPKSILLAIMANFMFFSAANAASLRITATSLDTNVLGDFVLEFDDLDNDGFISVNEITSFSGVNCAICGNVQLTQVTTVPLVAGLADGSGNVWAFTDGVTAEDMGQTDWSYVVASINDIPIPGAIPLFLAGIVGLGAAIGRRRRKASA